MVVKLQQTRQSSFETFEEKNFDHWQLFPWQPLVFETPGIFTG